jgi:hypothetical protein
VPTVTQPTYDDVILILRLYEERREPRLREARQWMAGQFQARTLEAWQKQCPPGSPEHTHFRMVTSYWEMVASFITSGVLNAELFFQSGLELLFVWEKIRDLLPALREANKNAGFLRNMEAVAKQMADYLNRHGGPEAYAAFSARVRGM